MISKEKKNKWLLKIKEWIAQNVPGDMIPISASFESKLIEETEEAKDQ